MVVCILYYIHVKKQESYIFYVLVVCYWLLDKNSALYSCSVWIVRCVLSVAVKKILVYELCLSKCQCSGRTVIVLCAYAGVAALMLTPWLQGG
jgi:hypothetical protein